MLGPRTFIRPLLAGTFIAGGIKTFRNPARVAPAAERIGVPIAARLGLPTDPETLVKLNAGIQVGAGALLAFGLFPRAAAVTLAGSLLPTTLAGHRFWEETEPAKREGQLLQFLKNASILGGLLAAAVDTGGRPSVFWTSRRAAGRAAGSLSSAAQNVASTVGDALQSMH